MLLCRVWVVWVEHLLLRDSPARSWTESRTQSEVGMGISKPPLFSSRGVFRFLACQNMFAVPHPRPCCGTQLSFLGLMPLRSLLGMGRALPRQSVSQPLWSRISRGPGTNKGLNLWNVHSGLGEGLHFRDRKLSILW